MFRLQLVAFLALVAFCACSEAYSLDISDDDLSASTSSMSDESSSDEEDNFERSHPCLTHEHTVRLLDQTRDNEEEDTPPTAAQQLMAHYQKSIKKRDEVAKEYKKKQDMMEECYHCGVNEMCQCNDAKFRNKGKFSKQIHGTLKVVVVMDVSNIAPKDQDKEEKIVTKKVFEMKDAARKSLNDVIRRITIDITSIRSSEAFGEKKISIDKTDSSDTIKGPKEYMEKFKNIHEVYSEHVIVWLVDIENAKKSSDGIMRDNVGFARMPFLLGYGTRKYKNPYVVLEREMNGRDLAKSFVHELGHVLGLYHTFRGEEVDNSKGGICSSCHEIATCTSKQERTSCGVSSDTTGDLCGDTLPMIAGYHGCKEVWRSDLCSEYGKDYIGKRYFATVSNLLHNWMSYSCFEESISKFTFTECQKRRMRCYLHTNLEKYVKWGIIRTKISELKTRFDR